MKNNVPSEGVCKCGGKLAISEIRRIDHDDEAVASYYDIEEIFECVECSRSYGRMKSVIPAEDIELSNSESIFAEGVDYADGRS